MFKYSLSPCITWAPNSLKLKQFQLSQTGFCGYRHFQITILPLHSSIFHFSRHVFLIFSNNSITSGFAGSVPDSARQRPPPPIHCSSDCLAAKARATVAAERFSKTSVTSRDIVMNLLNPITPPISSRLSSFRLLRELCPSTHCQ